MKERKNVYQLPNGDTTLMWYSKAVIQMKTKSAIDPTSWYYQAAIHGFSASLSFWKGITPLPPKAEQNQFWNQCQHGCWFFLPWHRMYLAYFEQIVGQTIINLGGPQDWALPFWDYSDSTNPNARIIPPAFTSPANTTNGLWITGRKGSNIPANYVTLGALSAIPFAGDGHISPLGFGGPETAFAHSGKTHGALESLPHDTVHSFIGGAMGDPRTSALDPIFWLHHANIDRLWQVWLNQSQRQNPTESSWLDFAFDFHDCNGNQAEFKSSKVVDTTQVLTGYTYQGVPHGAMMLSREATTEKIDATMPLEVVAATNKKVTLNSKTKVVILKLSPSRKKAENFRAITKAAGKPKTAILHFENITGKGVPPIYDIYLNVPDNNKKKESYYAGPISFFGVEEASTPGLHQSGSGQHYALDVSGLINKLRSLTNWKEQQLDIYIEPTRPLDKNTKVSIGRISLYSE